MLLGPVSISADYRQGDVSLEALTAHFSAALEACHATVSADDGVLVYTVSMRAPLRLSLRTPDLGLIARGTLEVVRIEGGYRVHMRVTPRSWFIVAALLPWLLLAWAIGVGSAPWHYLLALGGVPLVLLLWFLVWSNCRAFLDHAHALLGSPAAGR